MVLIKKLMKMKPLKILSRRLMMMQKQKNSDTFESM